MGVITRSLSDVPIIPQGKTVCKGFLNFQSLAQKRRNTNQHQIY